MRRAVVPGVLFLVGLGWQVSGYQNVDLAWLFWTVAVIWLLTAYYPNLRPALGRWWQAVAPFLPRGPERSIGATILGAVGTWWKKRSAERNERLRLLEQGRITRIRPGGWSQEEMGRRARVGLLTGRYDFWNCRACGARNDDTRNGLAVTKCVSCGTDRFLLEQG